MKKFNISVTCNAYYDTYILVPDDFDYEKALQYAKEHANDIPLGKLEHITGSNEISRDGCYFDD